MDPSAFDPRNQTFFIAGPGGTADIAIWMATIEEQRVRLANVSINYGVQLGLCILTLIVVLMLLPSYKIKRAVNAVQISALVVAVVRLILLVLYFPGPLSGYYVAWTQDASVLSPSDYYTNTVSNAFSVVQFCLIEDRGQGVDVDKILAFDRKVTLEDKRILESTDPDVPLDMQSERHMPSDQPGIAMRRILKRLIELEGVRGA